MVFSSNTRITESDRDLFRPISIIQVEQWTRSIFFHIRLRPNYFAEAGVHTRTLSVCEILATFTGDGELSSNGFGCG